MAKKDKNDKKVASKKADPIKVKPAVPASSKEILAKAAALGACSLSENPFTSNTSLVKKTADSSNDSSDASSSEESSSEEGDTSNKGKAPVRTTPVVGATFSLWDDLSSF